MRWTDSRDRLTGWVAGWVERNRGKGEGEGEGADGHVTENQRIHRFRIDAARGHGPGVGLSEIGERVTGKGKEPTATSRKTSRVHGFASQARRGEGAGVGAVNCTHVIVMWLIHNVVNEY